MQRVPKESARNTPSVCKIGRNHSQSKTTKAKEKTSTATHGVKRVPKKVSVKVSLGANAKSNSEKELPEKTPRKIIIRTQNTSVPKTKKVIRKVSAPPKEVKRVKVKTSLVRIGPPPPLPRSPPPKLTRSSPPPQESTVPERLSPQITQGNSVLSSTPPPKSTPSPGPGILRKTPSPLPLPSGLSPGAAQLAALLPQLQSALAECQKEIAEANPVVLATLSALERRLTIPVQQFSQSLFPRISALSSLSSEKQQLELPFNSPPNSNFNGVVSPQPVRPQVPVFATETVSPPVVKKPVRPILRLNLDGIRDLNDPSKVPMSPHPLTPQETILRKSLLCDIQTTPRSQLKPPAMLRKNTMKRLVSSEGVEVKRLQEVDLQKRINFTLKNRPSKEDLEEKNILKDELTKQRWAEKVQIERSKLRRALLKRPSVLELAEKEIIKETDLDNSVLHQETVVYTKRSRSHLYGISLFIWEQNMWCASGTSIRVFDSQGKLQKMIDGHTQESIRCVTITPDTGQVWSGRTDHRLGVFEPTGEVVKVLRGHSAAVRCLVSRPGELWSGASDGCVCVWDTVGMQLIRQLQSHTRSVNALCSVGDTVWSASDDKQIRVTHGGSYRFLRKLRGHMSYVTALALVGNRVWSGSEDRSVGIWDTKSYKFVKRLPHDKAVKSVVSVPTLNQALTGAMDGSVRVFDVRSFALLYRLDTHHYGVNCLFAQGTTIWCAYVDQTIVVWDAERFVNSFRTYRRKKELNQFKLSESFSVDFTFEEELADDIDEEYIPVLEYINNRLAGDKLYVDAERRNSVLVFDLLPVTQSKLIHAEVKSLLDARVVNLPKDGKLSKSEAIANNNLALNAAAVLGCDVSGISPPDMLKEQPDTLLPFAWQLVEGCIFSDIASLVKNDPRYSVLLDADEDAESLAKLPPEDILLRWFNYHLRQSGSDLTVSNFTTDIQNSNAYHLLLQQLNSECDMSRANDEDLNIRAESAISNANTLGCGAFLTPKSISKGNHLANMAFVAELFKTHSGLTIPENSKGTSPSESGGKGPSFGKLSMSSSDREIRSFLSWIHSFSVDPFVLELFDDLRDGLVLLRILNKISPGVVDWKKANLSPDNTFKRTENCNYVVELCHKLGLSLHGICGKDIEVGNSNLTLGNSTGCLSTALLWQLMRFDILNFLKNLKYEGKEVSESGMVDWANQRVIAVGRTSPIESFRDSSLATSHFLLDLLHSVNKDCVNYNLVTPGSTVEECILNAQYVINSAWKIGCSVYILWEDIVEVKSHMILVFVAALMMLAKEE